MNREVRLLVLLAALAAERSKSLRAPMLLALVREQYATDSDDPDSVRRAFRRDLDHLRDVGLVVLGDFRRDDHVRLAIWAEKDPAWHLTSSEHDALWRARRALRAPAPSPIPAGASRTLVVLGTLMRLIEEARVTDATELGQLTDRRATQVRDQLLRLGALRAALDEAGIQHEYDVEVVPEEVRGHELPQVVLHKRGREPQRPLHKRSLDLFGLFAYSSAEVNDRLAAIEAALSSGSPVDEQDLRSAQRKLLAWRERLRALHAPTSDT